MVWHNYNYERSEASPEFNSGLAYIYRLDTLFKHAHESRELNDLNKWFSTLVGIMTELNARMTAEQRENSKRDETFCENLLSVTDNNPQKRLMLWKRLKDWERHLHLIAHLNNLVMAEQDNADAARIL